MCVNVQVYLCGYVYTCVYTYLIFENTINYKNNKKIKSSVCLGKNYILSPKP